MTADGQAPFKQDCVKGRIVVGRCDFIYIRPQLCVEEYCKTRFTTSPLVVQKRSQMTDRTSSLTLPNGTFTIPDTVFNHDEKTGPIPNPSVGLVWGFTSRTPWHQMTATGQVGSEIGFSTYKVECQGIKSDGVRCAQRYDWTIEEPRHSTEDSEDDHRETLKAVAGAVTSCKNCNSTMVIPSPTFIPGSAHRITENLITRLDPSESVLATANTADEAAVKA